MPCYAGNCNLTLNSCVNITAARKPLPAAVNQVIEFGDDPFGFHQTKFKMTLLTIILMVAGGIVGLAVVGCLFRTALLGITSSVHWASRGQRLESNRDEKYADKDKDSFGNPSLDVKLPMALSSESRVDLIRTPTNFNGAHYIPPRPLTLSNNSSPYSTPAPSPQASTFVQAIEQKRAIQSDRSLKNEAETSIDRNQRRWRCTSRHDDNKHGHRGTRSGQRRLCFKARDPVIHQHSSKRFKAYK